MQRPQPTQPLRPLLIVPAAQLVGHPLTVAMMRVWPDVESMQMAVSFAET